jgi:DNA-directed RNA polymerase subunit RPC12/RpoP
MDSLDKNTYLEDRIDARTRKRQKENDFVLCSGCSWKLCKKDDNTIEIKCNRCKTSRIIDLKDLLSSSSEYKA